MVIEGLITRQLVVAADARNRNEYYSQKIDSTVVCYSQCQGIIYFVIVSSKPIHELKPQ